MSDDDQPNDWLDEFSQYVAQYAHSGGRRPREPFPVHQREPEAGARRPREGEQQLPPPRVAQQAPPAAPARAAAAAEAEAEQGAAAAAAQPPVQPAARPAPKPAAKRQQRGAVQYGQEGGAAYAAAAAAAAPDAGVPAPVDDAAGQPAAAVPPQQPAAVPERAIRGPAAERYRNGTPIASTSWAFTFWGRNPPWDAQRDAAGPRPFQHIGFQGELTQLGIHHWQGVITFGANDRRTATAIRALMGWDQEGAEAWLRPRRGSLEQELDYCKKERSRAPGQVNEYREFGEKPAVPVGDGWKALNRMIGEGRTMDEMREAFPELVLRNWGGIQKAREAAMKKLRMERRHVEVIVIIGLTGTGKTTAVHMLEDENGLYDKVDGGTHQNFDGLEDEEALLIDEFSPYENTPPLRWMNKVIDGWPLKLQIKHGIVHANYKRVYITSNYPLDEWYKDVPKVARDAFMRRIHHVCYFDYGNNVSLDAFLDWYPHRNIPDYPKPEELTTRSALAIKQHRLTLAQSIGVATTV